MSVANKTSNKIMKDSVFMSLKIMKIWPFFFMRVALGVTVFMVIVGEKSLFLVPLFFLMIADDALYVSKRNGKDQLSVYVPGHLSCNSRQL